MHGQRDRGALACRLLLAPQNTGHDLNWLFVRARRKCDALRLTSVAQIVVELLWGDDGTRGGGAASSTQQTAAQQTSGSPPSRDPHGGAGEAAAAPGKFRSRLARKEASGALDVRSRIPLCCATYSSLAAHRHAATCVRLMTGGRAWLTPRVLPVWASWPSSRASISHRSTSKRRMARAPTMTTTTNVRGAAVAASGGCDQKAAAS